MTIGGNIDVCRLTSRHVELVSAQRTAARYPEKSSGRRNGIWGTKIMEFLPLIGILIAAFVAWKLLKGVIKLAVIGLLVAGGAWFLFGGMAIGVSA
jgi:hypothetical protein